MLSIETNRLNFRQWSEPDFNQFADFFSTEANARHVGGVKTKEEAWRLMATYIGHYELKGYSYAAVEEKETRNLIGTVGLWKSEAWPEIELGYWILPEKQGKGYALEAAVAVKDFAFKHLKLETLVSYIDPSNIPSINLAKRLGGKFDKKIELLGFGEHSIYRYAPA
ncbi:MAG: GNAT family N-acetyltransferase [Cyclobacteriaceae bacterium]